MREQRLVKYHKDPTLETADIKIEYKNPKRERAATALATLEEMREDLLRWQKQSKIASDYVFSLLEMLVIRIDYQIKCLQKLLNSRMRFFSIARLVYPINYNDINHNLIAQYNLLVELLNQQDANKEERQLFRETSVSLTDVNIEPVDKMFVRNLP